MRFTYIESMCNPEFYVPLTQAAEAAGFHTFAMPDSIIYPKESDTKYPYTADGDREFLEDKPIIDPFSLIAYLGAVTSKIRFLPFVMKLPVRNPVLATKTATSIAVLINNRFDWGIGLSPWPEDYTATQTLWEKRGNRFDEMIAIIRGLSGGEYFEFNGEFYQVPALKLCPTPTQPIPLIIGGHSDAALKRAALKGDGWAHAGGDTAELAKMINRLHALRKEYGREQLPFSIHASSIECFSIDGVKKLADLGVTDLLIGFQNTYTKEKDTQSLEQKLAMLQGYAEKIIAKVNA